MPYKAKEPIALAADDFESGLATEWEAHFGQGEPLIVRNVDFASVEGVCPIRHGQPDSVKGSCQ